MQLDGELWLAKLPSRNDRISMPRLVFGAMKLAARCGLDVPEIFLRTIGGRDVFLAMRIGHQGRLAALGNLLSAAATFNLKPVDAADLILWMQTCVATCWRDELGKAGFDDSELDILAPSFGKAAL